MRTKTATRWSPTPLPASIRIPDRNSPSYLVIANDPEKEQVIGSLNALILNRLVTRINSKGNLPVSIIVDELPTLYFHKIDRLIGTARSNKVSVTLGDVERIDVYNTLQVKNYDHYEMNAMNPEGKKKYNAEHWDEKLQHAFEADKRMAEKIEPTHKELLPVCQSTSI